MLVFEEKTEKVHAHKRKKEYACVAAHFALSAKASNLFVALNCRSVMFPLKYLHCVYLLYIPSYDLFNCLFFFLSKAPELKGLMRKGM